MIPLRILEEQPEHIQISKLPLKTLLNLALRSHQSATRDDFEELSIETWLSICDLAAALDRTERLCHVEYPDAENGLKYPRLWYITPWRESYERYVKVKAKAEAERQIRFMFAEKIAELTAAVERDTGLEHELSAMVARGIMSGTDETIKRNKAKQFGVEIL